MFDTHAFVPLFFCVFVFLIQYLITKVKTQESTGRVAEIQETAILTNKSLAVVTIINLDKCANKCPDVFEKKLEISLLIVYYWDSPLENYIQTLCKDEPHGVTTKVGVGMLLKNFLNFSDPCEEISCL